MKRRAREGAWDAYQVPWYLPYPPCTISCFPGRISFSSIFVRLPFSMPATLRICVALTNESPRLRMTAMPRTMHS